MVFLQRYFRKDVRPVRSKLPRFAVGICGRAVISPAFLGRIRRSNWSSSRSENDSPGRRKRATRWGVCAQPTALQRNVPECEGECSFRGKRLGSFQELWRPPSALEALVAADGTVSSPWKEATTKN